MISLQWTQKIFPKFAYIPCLCAWLLNTFTYNVTKIFMRGVPHYDLSTPWDKVLPFLPWFISFYILAYVQWFLLYTYHSKVGKEGYYHIITSGMIAKLVCLVCFLAIPTAIQRPEVTGNGIFDHLTRIIYFFDEPSNLFPSIHCLESWLCFRSSRMLKNVPKGYVTIQFVFTLFVCASTVFVKQHFLVDTIAGIIALEIGWFLSKRFKIWRIFRKIELPSVKKQRGSEDVLS